MVVARTATTTIKRRRDVMCHDSTNVMVVTDSHWTRRARTERAQRLDPVQSLHKYHSKRRLARLASHFLPKTLFSLHYFFSIISAPGRINKLSKGQKR